MKEFEWGEKYAENILAGRWNGGGSNSGIVAEVVRDYINEGKFSNIQKKIEALQTHIWRLTKENLLTDFDAGLFSVLEKKLAQILENKQTTISSNKGVE